eukprot:3077275-Pleurochrysis_carterae.AAC.2
MVEMRMACCQSRFVLQKQARRQHLLICVALGLVAIVITVAVTVPLTVLLANSSNETAASVPHTSS